MQNVWLASAIWLGLALFASIISIRVAISVALTEIIVGAVAGNTIGLHLTEWIQLALVQGQRRIVFRHRAEGSAVNAEGTRVADVGVAGEVD